MRRRANLIWIWIQWVVGVCLQPKHYDKDMPTHEYWMRQKARREGWVE